MRRQNAIAFSAAARMLDSRVTITLSFAGTFVGFKSCCPYGSHTISALSAGNFSNDFSSHFAPKESFSPCRIRCGGAPSVFSAARNRSTRSVDVLCDAEFTAKKGNPNATTPAIGMEVAAPSPSTPPPPPLFLIAALLFQIQEKPSSPQQRPCVRRSTYPSERAAECADESAV